MKSLELQPTYNNLIQTFVDNTIARNKDVFQFISILDSIDGGCVIALDGNWGSGKTFFVKQVKMVLDAHNDYITTLDKDNRTKIINVWAQYHKNSKASIQPQVCVYYDAWENDNDEDPVLSLIYSILSNVETDFSFNHESDCIKIAASILEFFSGKTFGQLIESFKSDSPLTGLKSTKDIENTVLEFMESLLPEKGNRLIIFIDELDRCKPSYAVKLLERIKHYFSNDRITFVFSINTNELQNTIKQHYGNDFDACRYLDRFFDLHISLPPADLQRYYQSLNFNDSHWTVDIVSGAVIKAFHFEMREIAKYLRLVKVAVYDATHDSNKFDFSFSNGKGLQFGLMYVVPIMIGLKICNTKRYYDFIHGKDCTPILEVAYLLKDDFFYGLLNMNETYDEKDQGKTFVSISDKLEDAYRSLFVTQYQENIFQTNVGIYTFNKETRQALLNTASLLSKYSNYDI